MNYLREGKCIWVSECLQTVWKNSRACFVKCNQIIDCVYVQFVCGIRLKERVA
jgi:hypothetical protein